MILGHLQFFTENSNFQKDATLVKHDVKSSTISSICFTNTGTSSMSFGYNIFIPVETAQHLIYNYSFLLNKIDVKKQVWI